MSEIGHEGSVAINDLSSLDTRVGHMIFKLGPVRKAVQKREYFVRRSQKVGV